METSETYTIPKWFVRIASAVLGLAVPWALYVTMELKAIGFQLGVGRSAATEIREHKDDPDLHHHGFSRVNEELTLLKYRVKQLEQGTTE